MLRSGWLDICHTLLISLAVQAAPKGTFWCGGEIMPRTQDSGDQADAGRGRGADELISTGLDTLLRGVLGCGAREYARRIVAEAETLLLGEWPPS
jgi:hypothetical protein